MTKVFSRIFFIVLILSTILGCARSEAQSLKQVIINYNNSLVIALKSNPEILKEVATDREQGRVEIFITQLADEGKIIDAKMEDISFKKVEILNPQQWQDILKDNFQEHQLDSRVPADSALEMYKDGAQVLTSEVWSYSYLDKNDKRSLGPPQTIKYNVTYLLVQEEGKWKVIDIRFEETPVNS